MKKLFVVLALFVVSSLQLNVMAEMDQTDEYVSAINKSWNDAFNQGSITKLVELYESEAILSAGNGVIITGHEGIGELFQTYLDNGLHSHTIKTVSSHYDGSTLYQVAEWNVLGKKDGESYGGILTAVYVRDQDGNWKTKVHTWNSK